MKATILPFFGARSLSPEHIHRLSGLCLSWSKNRILASLLSRCLAIVSFKPLFAQGFASVSLSPFAFPHSEGKGYAFAC